MAKKTALPRYTERQGWIGGDSRTLYAFTDRRTGKVGVYPGGGGSNKKLLMHVGPEADVRVATRAEAEELWQNPLKGWNVSEGSSAHARKYGPKATEKIGTTMREFKRGKLKSSSGQKVKSREQAIAIGISQARRAGYKTPPEPPQTPSHATRKSPAQLDKEITEFMAKPKIGDPAWEREWSELLTEKHSKARMPTAADVERALLYVEREYTLADGNIDGEQLAEGLAFGRYAGDAEDKRRAKELFAQLPAAKWLRLAERANTLSREQDEAPRYVA